MANEPRYEIFPFKQTFAEEEARRPKQYGWRFRGANGQVAATGGESFTRREDAERAVNAFSIAATGEPASCEIKHV